MKTSKLYAIVATAFENINDKGGHPYFEHCLAVMKGLPECADEYTKQAALAHDMIEDIEGARDLLLSNGMSVVAIQLIENVSKRPGESLADYKVRVKSDIRSVYIKMSDLRHNSDIRRLKNKTPTARDIQRVIGYMEFYGELEILAKERGLI